MLLKNKTAVVYGAGGAIGSAVARAFAREGARVFLTGLWSVQGFLALFFLDLVGGPLGGWVLRRGSA